jgi:sortase (surface protein transpeptidase)
MPSALGPRPDRADASMGEEGLPSSPIFVRSARTATVLIAASLVALAGVLIAVVAWPNPEPRSDLATVSAVPAPTASTWTTVPSTTAATTTTTTVVPPPPARLRIPAIGVDAPVVPVGLDPDGSMEVPGATEVGWYEPGVRPGAAEGSAVLAAHVDYAGLPGAFFDLRSLPEGAEVFVVGSDGHELRFVVDGRTQVDKDELPVEELFRSAGAPTLTLITCGGSFDRSARHYEDNIVVRAVPAT